MQKQPLQTDIMLTAWCLCILEGGTAYIYIVQYISIFTALLMHLGIMSGIAAWVYRLHSRNKNISMPLFLLILHMALGPFGSISCVIMALTYHSMKRSHRFECFSARLSAPSLDDDRDESSKLYERIIFGQDSYSTLVEIEPFQDIFSYGSLEQKQLALMKITRYFRPQFAPILLYALKAPEASIRVQAATIIAKIEQNFMKQNLLLEKELARDPENIEKMTSLARLYDEYAHSGLLDDDSKHKSRNKSIEIYEKCVALRPDDNALKLPLGRLYHYAGQFEKAAEFFKICIDAEGLNSPTLVLWYVETLFAMQAFRKIRNISDTYPLKFTEEDGDIESREIVTMFESWAVGIPQEKMSIGYGNG